PFYVIYKPPAALIRHFQRKWPDVLWQVETQRKIVALTIDDAPSEHTTAIAKLLRENDAHATFFVIGSQVESRLDALGEIIRDGNELGNHAMHDEPSRSLTDAQLENEIRSGRLDVDDVAGPQLGPDIRVGARVERQVKGLEAREAVHEAHDAEAAVVAGPDGDAARVEAHEQGVEGGET
ncbi:hypothetical protein BN1708_018073, partial [Verticillium longisporum]